MCPVPDGWLCGANGASHGGVPCVVAVSVGLHRPSVVRVSSLPGHAGGGWSASVGQSLDSVPYGHGPVGGWPRVALELAVASVTSQLGRTLRNRCGR